MCFATIRHAQLVGELDEWGRYAARHPHGDGEATVGLVFGDDHGTAMRHARDAASRLIWVGADRFGQAAEARTLIPMMAAGRAGVMGKVMFSRSVSPLTDEDMADLRLEAAQSGVELSEVAEGVLHGKFLLWDNDNAVITSLNWSSAGTRPDNPWGEIGVHVAFPGLAAVIRSRLEDSLRAASVAKVEYRERREQGGRRRR
jgi:phosphatidylserine/phosphatidylglycerophosphate/cardiolipin synthase-like enzyme